MQPKSTPLSKASQKEEALWLLDKLVPDSGVNNIPAAIQVAGRLRTTALREAAARLLRKHEVLRTVFHDEGAGLRKAILAPEDARTDIEVSRSTADGLADDLTAIAARPFKFNGKPMLRICQVEAPEGDVLCIVAHHLVFDVASAQIVMGELTRLYDAVLAGQDLSGEAIVPVAAVTADEPRPESFQFWRDHLSGFDAGSLDLWLDRQGSTETTLKGSTVAHDLSDEARNVVHAAAQGTAGLEPVILLAAYYLLLAQHGAGPDIVIGSPADIREQAGRRCHRLLREHPGAARPDRPGTEFPRAGAPGPGRVPGGGLPCRRPCGPAAAGDPTGQLRLEHHPVPAHVQLPAGRALRGDGHRRTPGAGPDGPQRLQPDEPRIRHPLGAGPDHRRGAVRGGIPPPGRCRPPPAAL